MPKRKTKSKRRTKAKKKRNVMKGGAVDEDNVKSIEVAPHVSDADASVIANAVGAEQQARADAEFDGEVPNTGTCGFSLLKNDANKFVGDVVESVSPSSLDSSSFQSGGKRRRKTKKRKRKFKKSNKSKRKTRKTKRKKKKKRKMKLRFSQRPPMKL